MILYQTPKEEIEGSAVLVSKIFANVAEMVNAPVLNTGGQKWLVGSNPTVSVWPGRSRIAGQGRLLPAKIKNADSPISETAHRLVTQMARVAVSKTECRRFKSYPACSEISIGILG